MTRPASALTADVARFLRVLHEPGAVFEVRMPKGGRYRDTAAGYFDDADAAVRAALPYDGKRNVFVTLNPCNPALHARYADRIEPRADRGTTSDADIVRRHWLPLDIDARRPSEVSSTEDELIAAANLGTTVQEDLSLEGWPAPVAALSGNGCYLLYRVDLPNDATSLALVKGVLEALAKRFDTEKAHVDTSVHNAGRIIGVVGLTKTKGDNTSERPHRRSQLVEVPDDVGVVSEAQLRALLPKQEEPKRESSSRQYSQTAPPLQEMLDLIGADYHDSGPGAKGVTWFNLKSCPFCENESGGYRCGVGQASSGAYSGKCFCYEDKSWRDFKRALGLERFFRQQGHQGDAGHRNGTTPAPDEEAETPQGRRSDFDFAVLGIERTLAEALLEEGEHFARDPGGKLYRYHAGAYRTRGEVFVAQAVTRLLEDWEASHKWKPSLGEGVCAYILSKAPELWETPPTDRLCLENGVLDVATRELRPHSPEWLSTLQLPVRYDAAASCPENDAFMSQVYAADSYEAGVPYELEAEFMLPASGNRKANLFLGAGGTGKSTRLARLRRFLGSRNVAALSLQKLENDRFAVVQLFGKLANIAPDLPSQHLETSSTFKSITGGDEITGEYKFKDSFSFTPFVHLAFSANQPPQSKDASDAFFDRWRVHPFDRRFRDTGDVIPQPELLDRLCTPAELSGVLNKALKARGRHTVTPSMQAAFEELHEMTDPFSVWSAQHLVEHPDAFAVKAAVRRAYAEHARNNGIPEMTDTAFGLAMKRRYPRIELKQRTVGGVYVWCYIGLGLRANTQGTQGTQGSPYINQSQTCERAGAGAGAEEFVTSKANPVYPVHSVHDPQPFRCPICDEPMPKTNVCHPRCVPEYERRKRDAREAPP